MNPITHEKIKESVKNSLGEMNLYKIDRFKYPEKRCRHNQLYACDKCREDYEFEGKLSGK